MRRVLCRRFVLFNLLVRIREYCPPLPYLFPSLGNASNPRLLGGDFTHLRPKLSDAKRSPLAFRSGACCLSLSQLRLVHIRFLSPGMPYSSWGPRFDGSVLQRCIY